MPAIDPTLLALLSIFGGALLTVAAGFWGAWRQSKREHARWVRERRYEAYVGYLRTAKTLAREGAVLARLQKKVDRQVEVLEQLKSSLINGPDSPRPADISREASEAIQRVQTTTKQIEGAGVVLAELRGQMSEQIASFHLLGPESVALAADTVAEVLRTPEAEPFVAFRELERAMRAALAIGDFGDTQSLYGRHGRPPA